MRRINRVHTGITVTAVALAIGLLGGVSTVDAAVVSIEALYNVPGVVGGTASVTATYDDSGFTGSGTETFNFTRADLVFSPGDSLLNGTSHTVFDMFGIAFVNGVPVDLINYNNTEPNGKSKLIFDSGLPYPGFVGIYMSDSSSDMDLEGWWVTNHQGAQGHGLVSISNPVPVPAPAAIWLLGSALGLLGRLKHR